MTFSSFFSFFFAVAIVQLACTFVIEPVVFKLFPVARRARIADLRRQLDKLEERS